MPHYQFNSFSGRLKESTNFQPLHPISPTPLQSAEPPKMIFDTIKTKPVTNVAPSSSGVAKFSTLPPKLLEDIKKYQANMDVPVYKMKGKPDQILLGISYALVATGLVFGASFIYQKHKQYFAS